MLYYVQLVSLEEGRRIFQASSSVPRKSNEKILDLSSLFFPSARGGGIIQIKSWRLVLRRVNSLIWMDGQLADFSAVWNSNRFFYFSFRGLFLEPMRSRARPRGRLLSSHGITSRQIYMYRMLLRVRTRVRYFVGCLHWEIHSGCVHDRMYLLLTTFESSLSSPVSASLY